MKLLYRVHLSIETEFDYEHFQFLTRHYYQKLGLSIEEGFLSDPRLGLISSPKSKFRDQDKSFCLGRTSGMSNPRSNLEPENQLCRNSAPDLVSTY